MNVPSDETLMALADGEVDEAVRSELEAQIALDPELAKRFAVFTRTREPISQVFADRATEPVPRHLVALVRDFNGAQPDSQTHTSSPRGILDTVTRSFRDFLGGFGAPQVALASTAAAFVLGMGFNAIISPEPVSKVNQRVEHVVHATGGFTPESPIGSALESKRSGATFQLSEHGDHTMSFESILSFLGKNGSYCRQFLLKRTNSSGSNAVACRQPDGNWKLEILVAAKVNKAGNRIRTASALTSPEVDLVLDRLMGEIALDASDEIELIERGWRPQ